MTLLRSLGVFVVCAPLLAREERSAPIPIVEILSAKGIDHASAQDRILGLIVHRTPERLLEESLALLLSDAIPMGGETFPLSQSQRTLVRRGFESVAPAARRERLLEERYATPTVRRWSRLLPLGEGVFETGDLAWLLGNAHPRVPRGLDREVRSAVADILRRSPRAAAALGGILHDIPDNDRLIAIRALGDSPSRASLAVLTSRIGIERREDALVISRIGAMSEKLPLPLDSLTLGALRTVLVFGHPIARREAALVAGRVGDFESMPDLIELLASEDVGLRRNAYWSLTHMTQVSLRPVRSIWSDWYADQLDWWHGTAPILFNRLGEADSQTVVQALNALCTRQVFRHRVAERLTHVLSHPDPSVVRIACIGLGRQGSSFGLHELAACSQSTDADVQSAANTALETITGITLPPEFATWQAYLRSTPQ